MPAICKANLMDQIVIDTINQDFHSEEAVLVTDELFSIGLHHVMAKSEGNLRNTRLSILQLAKGDANQVTELTKRAKIDFRDVILWATQEK